MKQSNLVFVCNELINPEMQKMLNIPMEFITFAITNGKMYRHYGSNNVFLIPPGRDKEWGNTKVYGAVYLVKDYFFYVDLLDAYHMCSKNKLSYNHSKDTHHRISIDVTPIRFKSIEELNSLKYREGSDVQVISYIGNVKHPKIEKRFLTTKNYRVVNGVYEKGFLKQFREVSEDE